jgi:hypothetical protein
VQTPKFPVNEATTVTVRELVADCLDVDESVAVSVTVNDCAEV